MLDSTNLRSKYNKFVNFKGNIMFSNKAEENEYIKDYGMAYIDGEKLIGKDFTIDIIPQAITIYNNNILVDKIMKNK